MSEMIPDANSILMSGGGKFASFKIPNDNVTGTIVDVGTPYHVREWNQVTQRSDGPPRYTKAGKPVYAFHVTLTTDERRADDPEDDGTRVVDVNSWRMQDAIRNAVRESGATGLEVGARLTLTYTGDEVPGDYRSGKKFTASYVRPANVALMADGGQPATPQQDPPVPTPQPAPAAAQSEDTPAEKAQKLIALGMNNEQIQQVTGLDVSLIAAIRGSAPAPAATPF